MEDAHSEHVRKVRVPLLADRDAGFLAAIAKDAAETEVSPVIVSDLESFEASLKNTPDSYGGIFVSSAFCNPESILVTRLAIQIAPAVPIYLVLDNGHTTLTDEEITRLGFQKVLPKPLNYSEILELISSSQLAGTMASAASKGTYAQLDAEFSESDARYSPIRASNFVSAAKVIFDIFVRLGEGRFVKILQKGDNFEAERLKSYLQKGVTHFFLLKEEQQKYIKFCDQLAKELIKSPRVPRRYAAGRVMALGDEVAGLLRDSGISAESLGFAKKFTDTVGELVTRLSKECDSPLREYLVEYARLEHGVGVSMVAAIIARGLNFEADKCVGIVGLAAMLHDIGLKGLDPKFESEDETTMTPQEKELFYKHPVLGAELLSSHKMIDPTVAQAVLQHHERRDRKGFPNRPMSAQLNRVSEIVGISDEFIRVLKEARQNPRLDAAWEIEKKVSNSFSGPIIEAYRKGFSRK